MSAQEKASEETSEGLDQLRKDRLNEIIRKEIKKETEKKEEKIEKLQNEVERLKSNKNTVQTSNNNSQEISRREFLKKSRPRIWRVCSTNKSCFCVGY